MARDEPLLVRGKSARAPLVHGLADDPEDPPKGRPIYSDDEIEVGRRAPDAHPTRPYLYSGWSAMRRRFKRFVERLEPGVVYEPSRLRGTRAYKLRRAGYTDSE